MAGTKKYERLNQLVNQIISTSPFLDFTNKDDFRATLGKLSEGMQNERLKELNVPVAQRIPLLKFLGRSEKPVMNDLDSVNEDMPNDGIGKCLCLRVVFFVFLGVPVAVIMAACVFGALLAWAEDWTFREGFEYVSSNLLQLATPLTDVSPDNLMGEIIDIVIAVWSISVAGLAIGFMANFSFVNSCAGLVEGLTFTDNTDVYMSLLRCDKRLDLLTKGDGCFLAQVEDFAEKLRLGVDTI